MADAQGERLARFWEIANLPVNSLDYNGALIAASQAATGITVGDFNEHMIRLCQAITGVQYDADGAGASVALMLGCTNWAAVGSEFPSAVFDFTQNPSTLLPYATLTRASANGTYFDSSGVLQVAATNAPRWTYNPSTLALRGLLVEPARTNSLPNNTAQGLMAGTPGTMPTGWSATAATGTTRTLSAALAQSGITYFTARYVGTPTATQFINFIAGNVAAAVQGEEWGASYYGNLASGSLTGLVTKDFRLSDRDGAGLELSFTAVAVTPTGANIATQRVSATGTLATVGTAFVSEYLRLTTNNVTAIDYTLGIGAAQLEKIPTGESGISSVILTTGTAATRAADVLTLTVQPATYDISIVRESGTTTLTDVFVDGSYVVPTSVSPLQRVIFTHVGPVPEFNFYVDSVNGSDGNIGTSPNEAFQTLSALPTLTAGQSVGLARGSVWREEGIASTADQVRVVAYGTGARPIINGSAVAPNASFSKTGGLTNVYQISVTIPSGYPNAFEAGAFLMEAADQAACDATPGSRLFSGGVLYIHPFGSTNPISDGKLYEYSVYVNGVTLTGANTEIEGIEAGRQSETNGPLRVGPNGTISDFRIYQSNRHAMVLGAGANVSDGSCGDMYWPTYNGGGFLVFNQNVFAGETSTVSNVSFSAAEIGRCSIALDSHNSVSGTMAAIILTDCDFENCDISAGCDDVDLLTVSGGTVTNFRRAFTPFGNANIDGVAATNAYSAAETKLFCALTNNGQTVSLSNISVSQAEGSGFVSSTGDDCAVTIDTVTSTCGTWGGFPIIGALIKDGSLTVRNFNYDDDNGQYAYITGATGPFGPVVGSVALDSDFNQFSPTTLTWIIGSDTYSGFAAYTAIPGGSGQDGNSTAS